jgi:dTDP-4-dehydrorhamnose 3,5-epimerase-like enzyme
MIFPEVKIYQPDVFEDFRGELFTLFKQEESNLVFNHDKVSISKQYRLVSEFPTKR